MNFKTLCLLLFLLLPSCAVTIGQGEFLHPHRIPDIPTDIQTTNVTLKANDGTVLKGLFIQKQGNARTMIYFYGNNEDTLNTAPLLSQMAEVFKTDIFVMDYRGYGFSNGTSDFVNMSDDVLVEYDYFASELNPKGLPIFLYGRSLGTAFALHVAVNRPNAGVILQSPFTSPEDVVKAWERNIPWYVRWAVFMKLDENIKGIGNKSVDVIKTLKSPLLIIHGDKDKTIPFEQGKRMFESATVKEKTLLKLEGQGHNDILPIVGKPREAIDIFLRN